MRGPERFLLLIVIKYPSIFCTPFPIRVPDPGISLPFLKIGEQLFKPYVYYDIIY